MEAKRVEPRLEADQRRVCEDTNGGETGKDVYADGRSTRLSGSGTSLVASLGTVNIGAVEMSTVGVGDISRGKADDGRLGSSGGRDTRSGSQGGRGETGRFRPSTARAARCTMSAKESGSGVSDFHR
jgi:hypothetical protein